MNGLGSSPTKGGYNYQRAALARSYSRSKSPERTLKKLEIVPDYKREALEGFLADCILDTIRLEKLKVDLSHRFDFTIMDLFGIINQ